MSARNARTPRCRAARTAVSAFAAGAALMAALAAGAALAQSAGDAARGQELFHEQGCYGCHGFNGETGARDLVGTNSPIIADVETFTTYLRLRADQAPLLPSTRMPNYPESSLSDADVRDIYAFVSSLELDAPNVDDIATLRAILESAERPYEP